MPVRLLIRNTLSCLFLLLCIRTVSATPITYSLTQGGWEGGGVVTGKFSGEDLNNDGFINLADGEVSAYLITFSGNGLIPGFTHDLTDLQFFDFTVGSTGFRPSFPLYSDNGSFFYDADDHSIARDDYSTWITTPDDATVRVVPEPSILALFIIAIAGASSPRLNIDAARLSSNSGAAVGASDRAATVLQTQMSGACLARPSLIRRLLIGQPLSAMRTCRAGSSCSWSTDPCGPVFV